MITARLVFALLFATPLAAAMVKIPGGKFVPLYKAEKQVNVRMGSFFLDRYPVSNAAFRDFVQARPKWRRSNIKKLFAEKEYLAHWISDLQPPAGATKTAITNVSWFAARSFCEHSGKRLPTVLEWEYAASFGKLRGKNTQPSREILLWYSRPADGKAPRLGSGYRNHLGVHDLHGLVWEWVEDFNTALVTGESRGDGELDRNLFCGSASKGATDFKNYAAFMRYAYRSSLKANYTVRNLRFRCARTKRGT